MAGRFDEFALGTESTSNGAAAMTPNNNMNEDEDAGTSVMTGDASSSHRRRVVKRTVRRRKGDASDPGTVVSENRMRGASSSTATGGAGGNASTTEPLPAPPRRLSPRAYRAASTREMTPRAAGDESEDAPVVPQRFTAAASGSGGVVQPPPRRLSPRAARAAEQRALTPQAGDSSTAAPPRVPQRYREPSTGMSSFPPPPRRLSPRAERVATTRALTPQEGPMAAPPVPRRLRRRPQIPTDSQLEPAPLLDSMGNEVHPSLTPQVMEDGSTRWVLAQNDVPDSPRMIVGAPPAQLSRRAGTYMEARRRAIEEEAQRRQEIEQSAISEGDKEFPQDAFYERRRSAAEGGASRTPAWTSHCYDGHKWCRRTLRDVEGNQVNIKENAERLVRTLQPIQVAKTKSCCDCISVTPVDDALAQTLLGRNTYVESCLRFLNLQPIPLARAEIPELAHFSSARDELPPIPPSRGNAGGRGINPQRGLATLGGIWCTVDGIREDGRPASAKDVKPPRRVMRVCGGQRIGQPLKLEAERYFSVRCYELLLFPQESISPDAVNYGAEGITLGHVVPPPASSVPLTPRLVDDPVVLREYRKKLMTTKSRSSTLENHRDDRLTFAALDNNHNPHNSKLAVDGGIPDPERDPNEEENFDDGKTFLTQTIVSVNQNMKFTLDLNVVLLPYVERMAEGGKHLVEVLRFCPTTVVKNRKLNGVSLSFSTREAFIAAYKALLWATECNITDVTFLNTSQPADDGYARLRLCATISPLSSWSSDIDSVITESGKMRGQYQSKCLDFTALNLLNARQQAEYDPLRLEDFVVEEKKGEVTHKKSTIFTNTLNVAQRDEISVVDNKNATVVSYIPFGVIRRAVSQKTNDVYDVRVIPRSKMNLLPLYNPVTRNVNGDRNTGNNKVNPNELENEQVDRDVEAAIFLEYISRLPALSPVYAVILDEQRYYIFQEPWVSALAMEKHHKSSHGRNLSMEHNTQLKQIAENTVMMTLKDFIHAILHNKSSAAVKALPFEFMEAKLQLAQLLCAELLLLLVAIHGKGMLLGPCPPQRILVRIETSLKDDPVDEEDGEGNSSQQRHPTITSRHIQLFVPDLGINSKSWTYERQQCGVLEYLSPFYILEFMRNDNFGAGESFWTVYDDWWTYLCLCFELLAFNGSSLLDGKPSPHMPIPTPLISNFSSPQEIMDLWRTILVSANNNNNNNNEAATTSNRDEEGMSHKIRSYVHDRVLSAIAPEVDSWIAAKAEELDFFGTTGPRKPKRREGPGCPSPADQDYIGVSLSTMYLRGAALSHSVSPREPGEPPIAHAENILAEMPFVFYYREFFDAVLDLVLPRSRHGCGVHSPALYLLSHPFFGNTPLGEVFDGSWPLPKATQHFFYREMRKSKAEETVSRYRREAYQDPLTRRPEAPLLIGSYAAASPSGPFLLLSAAGQGDTPQSNGLVTTPGHRDPADNAGGPSRSQRLYTRDEQEEIEASENQVRNALHSQVTREARQPTPLLEAQPNGDSRNQSFYNSNQNQQQCTGNDQSEVADRSALQPPPRPGSRPADDFNQIEQVLNHMAAPSQTSTSMNSLRNSVWPNELVESSVQRSRPHSVLVDPLEERGRASNNSNVVYAPEPRPYGADPYYNEVLVPSDNE